MSSYLLAQYESFRSRDEQGQGCVDLAAFAWLKFELACVLESSSHVSRRRGIANSLPLAGVEEVPGKYGASCYEGSGKFRRCIRDAVLHLGSRLHIQVEHDHYFHGAGALGKR